MKKTEKIDRQKLTPLFKTVLKNYKKMNDIKKVTVADVTATLLNYMFSGKKTLRFDLYDMQELMHFIVVIERGIYKKKK